MATLLASDQSFDLSVNQFLLEALDQRWKNYRAELKRCRAEFSNEAVHDLRAAARRMLAFLWLLNSISPRPRLQKLNRAFKDQLDEFDDLRDTQVVLAEISETAAELPQLQTFQEYLQEVEKQLLKTLRKKLKVIDLFDVSKRIRRLRESLKAGSDANGELVAHILRAVDDVFLITKQRQNWITPAQANTIHRVRLTFKTFRYMVEIIHPLLSEFPSENLKRMHDYQSLMGEIQDVEVIMQALADAPMHAFDPEPVRRYYERCHTEAISAYMKCIQQLDTFWRPAPDQPFPWER